MTDNAFEQPSLLNEDYIHKNYESNNFEKKKNKNYFSKILTTLGCLSVAACFAYDTFKPTINGEILGGSFSNEKISELYIKNFETKKTDTVYFDTRRSNTPTFTLSIKSENYRGKASYLEETLRPGTTVNVSINNSSQKKVHKINNTRAKLTDNYTKDITSKF